jgi:hypothetical protein
VQTMAFIGASFLLLAMLMESSFFLSIIQLFSHISVTNSGMLITAMTQRWVQRFTVVDKSDFSPTRLTVSLASPYKNTRALPSPDFKQ